MIGGLVAMTLDRSILRQLGMGRRTVVVTGTNGKSTTTRIASGLPMGGDLEFADELTLGRALAGRRVLA